MKKVEIELNREMSWPNCCAYCMRETNSYVKGKSSIISGINPFFYTRKFITFKYPVCKKHKSFGRFLSFFMHQSTVDLFVGSIIFPILVYIPIKFIPAIKPAWHSSIFLSAYVLYILIVIFIKLKMPIKFGREVNNKVKIRFANNNYAKLFEEQNS